VFEGNGVILNLRANTENKKNYPSILMKSVMIVILLYMAIAIVCYPAFRMGIPTYVIDDKSIDVNGF
jgi:hypothetical protein